MLTGEVMNPQEAFIGFAFMGLSVVLSACLRFLLSKMQSANKHCGLCKLLFLVSSSLALSIGLVVMGQNCWSGFRLLF